jgi:hypothetical protein
MNEKKSWWATLVMASGDSIRLEYETLAQLHDRLTAQVGLTYVLAGSPVFYYDPTACKMVQSTFSTLLKHLHKASPSPTENLDDLRRDAARWREFAYNGDLMITDFGRRLAGTFHTTKEQSVDAALERRKKVDEDKKAPVSDQAATHNAWS